MLRQATHDDIPRLVQMGERFLNAEYASHACAYALAKTLDDMVTSDSTLLLVACHDEEVIGVIGVLLFSHPFTGELVASETFWWVEPERRGHGVKLMKCAEAWARGRGAKKMQMGSPAGHDMSKFYARAGYVPTESTYQRSL